MVNAITSYSDNSDIIDVATYRCMHRPLQIDFLFPVLVRPEPNMPA